MISEATATFNSRDEKLLGTMPSEFELELVTRSLLSRSSVLAQICEASGERLGIFV
jgi:hypothetical protein